jgi:hypothetical protein
MSRRGLALSAAAAVFLAALTGVSLGVAGPGRPRLQPGHAAAAEPGSLTTADTRLLHQAEQILIRACMARHGFRYWLAPPPAGPQFPYLVSSVAWARRYGFGGEPEGLQRAANASSRYIGGLLPAGRQAYGIALNGAGPGAPGVTATIPQGGEIGQNTSSCRTRAETGLYRQFRAWFRADSVTDDLPAIWEAEVLNDPGYQRAVRRWARCMHAAGYRYASPAQAAASFVAAPARRPRAAEVRVAVAEAGCVARTGLERTARQLIMAFARPLRARYRADLSVDRRLSLAALGRARAIVRSGH